MKRSLLVLSCLALTFACTPTDDPGNEGETGSAGDGDGDLTTGDGDGDPATGDGDGDPTTTGGETVATLDGVLVDAQGAALPSPLLQFCGPIENGIASLCIGIDVDPDDGAFHIDAMFPGLWAIKVVQAPADGRFFAGQSFQMTVNDGDMLDLSPPIVLPETDALTPLDGPTLVDIDGILSLTVDPALAQSPDFVAPTDLGGLAPPMEHWRVTDIDGSPVIAAWTFSPFGIKSTEGGFDFTVADSLGLGAGESVVFWEIEKDNGETHEIATGTVNGDASAIDVVPTGDGLHELSWLLVTQP